jgi:hypothetical protein
VTVCCEQEIGPRYGEADLFDSARKSRLKSAADPRVHYCETVITDEQITPQRSIANVGVVGGHLKDAVAQGVKLLYRESRLTGLRVGVPVAQLGTCEDGSKNSCVCWPRSGTPRCSDAGVAEKTNGVPGVRKTCVPSPIPTSQNMSL